MWKNLVRNKNWERSYIFLLSFEHVKWLYSCFINVAFVTLFSALVRVLKSLPIKVIPRERHSSWLFPQWEWLHYFSFSLAIKHAYIINNGRNFLQQGKVCHILGHPESTFPLWSESWCFGVWSVGEVCLNKPW